MNALFPTPTEAKPANPRARERRVSSRNHADFYRTPEVATLALLERESFPGAIWEPACGDGAMSLPLKRAGYRVTSSDLVDRGFGIVGTDFLAEKELPAGVESIVTNPPFKFGTAFARHALDLGARKIALLCRVAFLEGQERRPLLEQHLSRVWVFSRRITLWRGDDPEARDTGGAMAFAWFVFERGQRGPTVGFIPCHPPKPKGHRHA